MTSAMGRRPSAFVLLGPTASGKSRLALGLARKWPLEIVSLDSAQVYRGMDIGTAKPSPAEQREAPHHLIDIREPTERYSAGQFVDDAVRVTQEILARGRRPLLVGGTMLYYRSLAQGMDALPPANPEVRAQIDEEARRSGWPALHAALAAADPATASRLQPGDRQRIQRALEVLRTTGRPISSFHTGAAATLPFDLRAFALVPEDRALLHRRIAQRFDAMLVDGLVDELAGLRQRYALQSDLPSMRCVGYRQAWQFLEGALTKTEFREAGVAATRQLAKRQLTWLRSLPGLAPATHLESALAQA